MGGGEEVATKAPESDASVQDTPPPEPSTAHAGPAMGDHCVTDRPTPPGEVPTGELTKLGDVDVYVTKPADYPHSPSKLLLLLTGGTGIKSTNNQLQADKFASEGFLVIMPDQFNGDPAPNSTHEPMSPASSLTFLERFKLGVADTAKSFLIDMWLARHTPEKVLPLLHRVIAAVRDEHADAIAAGGGIYAVGYCFGAKYALVLGAPQPPADEAPAADDDVEATAGQPAHQPLVKVVAIAHGTQVDPSDIGNLAVPACLVCVENDPLFPDDVRAAGVEALEKRGVEHEVKVYPEVPHGFAVYGDYEDAAIQVAQRTAYGQMLGWIQAH